MLCMCACETCSCCLCTLTYIKDDMLAAALVRVYAIACHATVHGLPGALLACRPGRSAPRAACAAGGAQPAYGPTLCRPCVTSDSLARGAARSTARKAHSSASPSAAPAHGAVCAVGHRVPDQCGINAVLTLELSKHASAQRLRPFSCAHQL